jgi:acyl-CoA thioesterase
MTTSQSPRDTEHPCRFDVARARATEASLPILRYLGCRVLESDDADVVRVEMRNDASTQNSMGHPHGGALAALADHAGGLTASLLTGRGGPTADLHIRFLAPASDSTVVAECRLLRAGRRIIVTEVRVHDGASQLLAIATVTSMPSAGTSAPPD